MAFTVRDYHDLLSLLNAHPEWREELRRVLLSDDFLALPQIVRELVAAQKRTDEQLAILGQRVDELAAAQKRTEEQLAILGQRVDELVAAQKRTEERLDGVETRLDRVETRLDGVETRLDGVETRLDGVETRLDGVETRLDSLEVELGKTRSELGRLSAVIGASLEDEAGSVLATVMRQKGYRVLQDASALRFNGDVDVVLPVEDEQGRRLWVLMESKMRLSRADVLKWAQRIRSAEWRDALKNAGCQPPYLAYIYAIRSDLSAREAAREHGIGLARGDGEVIAPAGEIE